MLLDRRGILSLKDVRTEVIDQKAGINYRAMDDAERASQIN